MRVNPEYSLCIIAAMLAKLMSYFLLGLIRVLTGAQARWHGCPPKAEQRIYFANHQSHADLVMIWAALPEELRSITRPIAARDYWANTPFKRWITTEVFNAIYVERGGGAPVVPPEPPAPPAPPLGAERGGERRRLPAANHLASGAGGWPGNPEAAGKRKRGQPRTDTNSVRTLVGAAAGAAPQPQGTFGPAQSPRLVKRLPKQKA